MNAIFLQLLFQFFFSFKFIGHNICILRVPGYLSRWLNVTITLYFDGLLIRLKYSFDFPIRFYYSFDSDPVETQGGADK